MKKILQNKTLHWAIGISLLTVVGLLIFTPNISFLKRLSNYTVYAMLFYLALAMLFFVLDQKRLMLFSFVGCGLLCIYLKGSSNQNMRLAQETSLPKIAIALINLSLVDDSPYKAIVAMKTSASDVIVVQELDPNWERLLKDSLLSSYPYHHSMVRIDQFGMGIFSKFPILQTDTFEYEEVPNLHAKIKWQDSTSLDLISSITIPPVSFEAFKAIESHFEKITDYTNQLDGPLVTVGNYYLAPWADEIKEFRYRARLNDGRRDATTRTSEGSVSFSAQSVDHIFFNDQLACIGFNELSNSNFTHLGILGTYQIKSNLTDEEEPLID